MGSNKIIKFDSDLIKNVIILIILFCFIIVEVFILSKSVTITEGEDNILYYYTATPSANYTVTLKDNKYIDAKQLNMNRLYISKLVDNIISNFKYNYVGSENANINYTYGVSASIIGEYQSSEQLKNNRLWNKSFDLVLPVTKSIKNKKDFTIEQSSTINYDQYNAIVDEFYKDINLPMNSYLSLLFKVNVNSNPISGVGEINEESSYEIKIPLHEQVFQITTKVTTNEKPFISKYTDKTRTINKLNVLFVGMALIITILLLIIYCYKKFADNKQPNVKRLNRILSEYGDIIVEINNIMDISKLSIIEVKSFNEMVDLQAELHTPILYYEKGKCSLFMVINEGNLYRFVLNKES